MCNGFDAFLIIIAVLPCHFSFLLSVTPRTLKQVTNSRGIFSIQSCGLSEKFSSKLQ